MTGQYILSDYLENALAQAEYDKLEDGTFFGRIPACKGVVAFGGTLHECETELRSTLEDWVLVGLKLGHSLSVLDNVDLNRKPEYEMETV
ncbi:MAG: type II toxin-antitoxin system HicB family antitoxin [Pyrinomonadaceae bacterium]